MEYIIGAYTIDYIRLTTWLKARFDEVAYCLDSVSPVIKRGERLAQYVGDRGVGWYAGEGKQRGEDHYRIEISGTFAHRFYSDFAEVMDAMTCKRLDVQITHRCRWRHEGMRFVGKQRGVSHIPSRSGDTVYLASRSSDRFARVYLKDDGCDEAGEYHDIRWEYQLANEIAEGSWGIVRSGVYGIATCWAGEYENTMRRFGLSVPREYAEVFGAPGWVDPRRAVVAKPDPNLIGWLYGSVVPAVQKASRDHDDPVSYGVVVALAHMVGGMDPGRRQSLIKLLVRRHGSGVVIQ